jgi:branched-chain amino acid aminotransferase
VPAVADGGLVFEVEVRDDRAADDVREAAVQRPVFGTVFTDHMVSADWTAERGWHDAAVTAYKAFEVSPAAAVLHYAQEIFEGLKAYRHADGTVWGFRPERNARRFAASARRLALPELPEADFVESLKALVRVDQAWVPVAGHSEKSLYLRPFMIAVEPNLAVRPSRQVRYGVIASPAGAYFANGVAPVSIWLSTAHSRAALGGTGAAKCGGNYGASLAAQAEAQAHGCEQVAFLDAATRTWVEESGSMNLCFVYADGRIVTPELGGAILDGVTRASILELARDLGHPVEERPVALDEWRDGVASGRITEVFACGTAAVVTPVGRLVWAGGEVGTDGVGPVTSTLRKTLLDLQFGRIPDNRGWLTRLA